MIDASELTPDLQRARSILGDWDRTAAATSRGGVLFKAWFNTYMQMTDTMEYRVEWDRASPTQTPFGVGRPGRALAEREVELPLVAEAPAA